MQPVHCYECILLFMLLYSSAPTEIDTLKIKIILRITFCVVMIGRTVYVDKQKINVNKTFFSLSLYFNLNKSRFYDPIRRRRSHKNFFLFSPLLFHAVRN